MCIWVGLALGCGDSPSQLMPLSRWPLPHDRGSSHCASFHESAKWTRSVLHVFSENSFRAQALPPVESVSEMNRFLSGERKCVYLHQVNTLRSRRAYYDISDQTTSRMKSKTIYVQYWAESQWLALLKHSLIKQQSLSKDEALCFVTQSIETASPVSSWKNDINLKYFRH